MGKDDIDQSQKMTILEGIPGFDQKTFVTLVAETSVEVANSILHEFMNTLRDSLFQLNKLTLSRPEDIELIGKVCHRVKGSSQLVGFLGLSVSSEKLRMSLKIPENSPEWIGLLEQFRKDCALTEHELMRIF